LSTAVQALGKNVA